MISHNTNGTYQQYTRITEDLSQEMAYLDSVIAQVHQRARRDQLFFHHGPLVCFTRECAAGWPVAYVSPNVVHLLGYRDTDLIRNAMPYSKLVHPDDRDRVTAEVHACSAEGHETFEQEYRLVHINGEIRWVYDFTTALCNEAGIITHYYGYIVNITTRKDAEEQACQNRQLLQTMIDTLPQAICWKDRTFVYRGCNQAFATLAGVGIPENIVGKTDDDVSWTSDSIDILNQIRQHGLEVITAEQTHHPESRASSMHRSSRITTCPLHDKDGTVIGILSIFDDIP